MQTYETFSFRRYFFYLLTSEEGLIALAAIAAMAGGFGIGYLSSL